MTEKDVHNTLLLFVRCLAMKDEAGHQNDRHIRLALGLEQEVERIAFGKAKTSVISSFTYQEQHRWFPSQNQVTIVPTLVRIGKRTLFKIVTQK